MTTTFDPFSQTVQAGSTVLNTISNIGKSIKALSDLGKQKSLIELTSAARVEPLTIIGNDCTNLEYMPDVMQSLQSIFSGYYLQAVNITTTVIGVQMLKKLDRLNPHREIEFLSGMSNVAVEGISDKNPIKHKLSFSAENFDDRYIDTLAQSMALERDKLIQKDKEAQRNEKEKKEAQEKERLKGTASFSSTDLLKENVNLSVGKLFEVSINEAGATVKIPVAIRLMVATVPDSTLETLLSTNVVDNTFSERWHGWRSGRLSFIKDLILCQDLITEHKKALIKDKTGVYANIIATANANKVAAVFSDQFSLASASNLFVISEATAEAVENRGNGKFKDPHFRGKIFDSGYAMIIAVVDRQWDRVTFYHRGIATPTNMGIRDLKAANKGNGIDISDVMKAFAVGNNPRF